MEGVRRVVSDYRQRLGKGNPQLDRVRLAIDEWGIVRDWDPTPDGPGVGSFEHYYPLGDGLASARALHELLRSADVVGMANWAQTVNVIGAIKTSRNYAVMDSVGHLLALYRARVGGNLIPVKLSGKVPLDAVAAVQKKTGRVSAGLVNFSASEEVMVRLDCGSMKGGGAAHAWRINGPSLSAINVPGQPETITTEALPPVSLDQPMRLPAHSITVLTWP
jgi:alpha-N-arabinofuranosidase